MDRQVGMIRGTKCVLAQVDGADAEGRIWEIEQNTVGIVPTIDPPGQFFGLVNAGRLDYPHPIV